MNKIYKVMYSKVKQCAVVVSEIAKSHGHNEGRSAVRKHTALTAAVLIALGTFTFMGTPTAQAGDSLKNNDFVGANSTYWYWDTKKNTWTTYDYKLGDAFNNRSWTDLPNYNGAGAKLPGSIAAGLYAQAGQETITIGDRNAGQSRGSVFIGEQGKYNDGGDNNPSEKSMQNNYVTAVGFQSDATGWGSIAIGSNAVAENTKKTDTTVNEVGKIGNPKTVSDDVYGIESNPSIEGASVALGYNAHAKDGNIAIGAYSQATEDSSMPYVSVGGTMTNADGSTTPIQRRITNVADGDADSDVATIAQLKAATGSGFHFYGTKDTDVKEKDIQKDTDINKDVDLNNYNGGGAAGEKTVAIGSKVVVTGDRSNSVGYANTVKGTLSDVYGNGNTIAKDTHNAVVLGNSNKVGSNSVAIGTWNKEKATNSVFIGGNDVSTTEPDSGSSGSPFTGWEAGHMNPDGTWTKVDGGDIRVADPGEVGDGEDLGAKKNNTDGNTGWDDDDASVAAKASDFGFSVPGGSTDTSGSTGSTGTTTDETIDKVTVVGKAADASGVGSVSLGYGAKSGNGNIAIGYNSQATKAASTNAGYLTDSKPPKSYVSVGDGTKNSDTQYRRITNVADGSDEQDAVTVAQLKKQETKLTSDLSVKPGWGINKADVNTISVKHNLSTGSNAYADTDASGLILGGSVSERKDSKQYGAATETSVIVGAGNALASGAGSVVAGGLDNVASGANSTVVGGDNNNATASQSAVFGGRNNTASGITSTASGGIMNVANGQNSTAVGGTFNYALGTGSTSVGGYGKDYATGHNSSVNGSYSVGIAGGSTGDTADYSLAAGRQAVVTTENGTAVGYQATTDESGTISFGHDAGDVSGYTVTWKQRTDGKTNADLTTNDYTQAPESVTATTYTDSYYNRLVKVAEGQDDHDVVVVKQLKQYAQKDAGNIGSNIKVYTTDKNGNSVEDTDASTAAQKANENLWGTAIGTGKIADSKATNAADNGSQQLVTGGTVYTYNAPVAESGKTLNYVSADKTTGQNLTALDTQVKANADTLNDSTHNIKYYSVNSTNAPTFGLDAYTNEKNDGASPSGRASLAAGFITHTDGLASTVAGSYSGIYNKGTVSGTDFRGAAALSLGTVNINRNTDTTKAYSGVANSLIGQANVTTNSNAAIILGAGNTVKNSYRDVDTKTLFGSGTIDGQMRAAVPKSGGQVMVMGGGNSVDKAYMTQVTGVGNTVTGSGDKYDKDSSTQLNYVDGFYTTLENGKNDYIIGSHNTVTGTSTDKNKSNIVFGDNHTLTNTKNNVILGSLDAVDETTVSDVVSIGHNAKVTKEGGVAIGSGSEATTAAGVAGYDPTDATADTTAAWTSKKAAVSVGTADETRQITGVAAGKEETDAVNVAQLKKLNGMKANVDATNIGKNLKGAGGNTASAEDITANEKAWGAALGTGDIATPKDMLVTDKAIHDELRPTTDGTYVKGSQTTADNLSKLDAQVKTNADGISTNTTNITKNAGDITNLKNLSNITNEGEKVIKKLSKDAVKVEAGDRVTVTSTDNKETGTITYKVSANNNGTVTAGDQNLVSGDTVNTAINNAITNAGTATDTKLAGKANVDATNIGKNLKGAGGNTASAEDITANEKAWGAALGTGDIATPKDMLVTDKAIHDELRPTTDGTYVKGSQTTADNLSKLDAQVKTNADGISTNTTNITKNAGDITNLKNLSNITEAGQTVIKNLAKGSIGMEDGSHTSVSHRDVNGVETYKVDVTVDGQVAEKNTGIVNGGTVYSALQDVKNQTSADLANKANVDASNLTPDNVTKWQEKLGNGKVESGNTGLVTGDTVFKAVDTKANRDGSNLTDKEADSFSEKIARGEVKAGENRAVSGDAVSQAISKVTGDMNTKLDGKANTSLDNITYTGKNVIRDLAKGSVKVIDGTNTTVTTVEGKGEKPTTYAVNVEGKGTVTSGNTGLISGGTAYTELRPADGTYVKRSSTTAANLSALDTGLKNTSSLIHTNTSGDTIHIGETSKASKVDVSSTDANGNKNGRVITGVISDAGDPNSAANVGYVNGVTAANTQQIYRDMNSAYGRLNNNINKAAAGSNALAALHPLDYDPDDKADFAVGYGHYRNANAAAVGAFYHPNENTMVNVGVSLGNGDPGFNAGVSFKIGSGSAGRQAMSKTEMAKVINSQSKEIDALKKDNADKDKRIDALEQKMAEILAKLDKNGK